MTNLEVRLLLLEKKIELLMEIKHDLSERIDALGLEQYQIRKKIKEEEKERDEYTDKEEARWKARKYVEQILDEAQKNGVKRAAEGE